MVRPFNFGLGYKSTFARSMSWVDVGRPKKSVAVRSRANILIPYLCEHHLRFPAMAWKMRNPFAIPATRGLLKAKGLQTSVS